MDTIIEKAIKNLSKVARHEKQGRLAETDDNTASAPGNVAAGPEACRLSAATPVPSGKATISTIQLDYDSLKKVGIFSPEEMPASERDEFRRIKRPLLTNAFGKDTMLVDSGNLIMVTSSLPEEGKTFTAFNLALSITLERDHTVLLIDADASKSDLTRLLGLEGMPGLTDLLLDEELNIGDVLVKTDIPNLKVLPSGRRHALLTELVSSKRMKLLVAEIGDRYNDRVVIFDSPPLLLTTEAQMIADLSGQIAVVVKAGSTPQHVVSNAIGLLNNEKPIGLVLNQTKHMIGVGEVYGYYGQEND